MEIDWFTVIAQIVNFLILLWLLRKFLYGPIVRAMRERQERVAARMEEAQAREQEAIQEAQSYKLKRQELADEKAEILAATKEEAEARRRELVHQARQEADEMQSQWAAAIAQEKEAFVRELRKQAAKSISEVARRALGDLADQELEQQVLDVFIDKLDALDTQELTAIRERANEPGEAILIRTAFPLSDYQENNLRERLKNKLDVDSKMRFDTDPTLTCGVQMTVKGRRIAWSFGDYIDELEEQLTDVLERKSVELASKG